MELSRRHFLWACSVADTSILLTSARAQGGSSSVRKYHLSISPDALQADPTLLELAQHAGVTDVWLTGFLYGYWYYPLQKTQSWRERVEKLGMTARLINVPLGHPGDSLGATSGTVPLTPPRHWHLGRRPTAAPMRAPPYTRPPRRKTAKRCGRSRPGASNRSSLMTIFAWPRDRESLAVVSVRNTSRNFSAAPATASPNGPICWKRCGDGN